VLGASRHGQSAVVVGRDQSNPSSVGDTHTALICAPLRSGRLSRMEDTHLCYVLFTLEVLRQEGLRGLAVDEEPHQTQAEHQPMPR
jgi:hypothetical protein